jgi:hypothetical protein
MHPALRPVAGSGETFVPRGYRLRRPSSGSPSDTALRSPSWLSSTICPSMPSCVAAGRLRLTYEQPPTLASAPHSTVRQALHPEGESI